MHARVLLLHPVRDTILGGEVAFVALGRIVVFCHDTDREMEMRISWGMGREVRLIYSGRDACRRIMYGREI